VENIKTNMRTCETYNVTVWLGHRTGYSSTYTDSELVTREISAWCKKVGQAVTMTHTKFVYVDGTEPGTAIGFINYPRYPKEKTEILDRALELGEILRTKFHQFRVSIVAPDTTYLLEDEEK